MNENIVLKTETETETKFLICLISYSLSALWHARSKNKKQKKIN